ncbi:MAG: AmmeMemoRadiSam system protein A [Verrucomicrobia bacterium]|nr:AmmeMemoRadiSam system protein A [Verrucomicrobiota bacterium]
MDQQRPLLMQLENCYELLKVAQNTVERTVLKIPLMPAKSQTKNCGVFASIYVAKQLRGCFGKPFPDPHQSLEELIQEISVEAATDPRFPPITREDLPSLTMELSFLTTPQPITVDQIRLGVHGLIVEQEGKTSVFLPKVATDKNWDVETLLNKLCLKAELHEDAWKKGAALSSFQVQVVKN